MAFARFLIAVAALAVILLGPDTASAAAADICGDSWSGESFQVFGPCPELWALHDNCQDMAPPSVLEICNVCSGGCEEQGNEVWHDCYPTHEEECPGVDDR
jgi:hypothetical protein